MNVRPAIVNVPVRSLPVAFAESFAILTGGRLSVRVPAAEAASLLRKWVAPRLAVTVLEQNDAG